MRVAFISDVHLTPQNPSSQHRFEEFMRAAGRLLQRLYILGDLFDYWVGDDGADALGQAPAEAALRDAIAAGVEVFFMRGNRDFLVGDDFARRVGCAILPDPTLITLGQRRLLLSHGDRLCTDDIEHQQARQQMLSAKWQRAFLRQPLAQRMDVAAQLRRQSEADKRTKSAALMDVNQAAVQTLMRRHAVATLVHGHTHRPAVHRFDLDAKPAWRYVLGDWYTQNSALYYHDGSLAFKKPLP